MELLNHEEIKAANIFSSPPANLIDFTDACVNLSTGKIVTMDEEEVDVYKIPPRGMAVVMSNEIFSMPLNVVGYTTVKNQLSRKGIMAINIGIVDNGFKGPISSLLLNFGRKPFPIKKGDTFLRMTFHQFKAPSAPGKTPGELVTYKDLDSYMKSVKKDIGSYLDPTFLAITEIRNSISQQVTARIGRIIATIVIAVTLLGFLFSTFSEFGEWRKQREKLNYEGVSKTMDSVSKASTTRFDSVSRNVHESEALIRQLLRKIEDLEQKVSKQPQQSGKPNP